MAFKVGCLQFKIILHWDSLLMEVGFIKMHMDVAGTVLGGGCVHPPGPWSGQLFN